MRDNLALFTIIVLASVITISFIDNPIFAEQGSIVNATITIIPTDFVIKAGDTKQMTLLIDNSEKNNPITVEKILVSQWSSTDIKEFEVMAQSSKTKTFDVKVPADTPPDKYFLVIYLKDSLNKTEIVYTKLTVERFKPLELSWMIGLLGAYLIPAQIIERIIEPIKNIKGRSRSRFHTGIEDLTHELEFWTKLRTSIMAKQITETTKSNFALKDTGSMEESKSFYHGKFDEFNKKVDEISMLLSKAKTTKAWTTLGIAMGMASIPAILFSFYGLGILQIIGINGNEIQLFDAIINTLFIGSGTKPIHDTIGYITKGKKAQEKKVEI